MSSPSPNPIDTDGRVHDGPTVLGMHLWGFPHVETPKVQIDAASGNPNHTVEFNLSIADARQLAADLIAMADAVEAHHVR